MSVGDNRQPELPGSTAVPRLASDDRRTISSAPLVFNTIVIALLVSALTTLVR